MDRPTEKTLARMPLAEAVLLLWRWVTREDRLRELWNTHRGRCYEKVISFSLMVHLIADALLKYEGSGRRSSEKNLEAGELTAGIEAAYKRLRLAVRRAARAVSTSIRRRHHARCPSCPRQASHRSSI